MFNISKENLERLREQYPAGARVELIHMDDPYNTKLVAGCKGTVRCVDDAGTIHIRWDCGSSLGVVYGEDSCRVIDDYDFEEICPHCDYVNRIKWDGESKTTVCQDCGKVIALCNNCEDMQCGNCKHND